MRLAAWAETAGLAPSTMARGFLRAYGVSPKRYRAEVRALKAWRCIATSPLPLADLALELGFADQAHMTRALVELTGRTPAAVRRAAGRARRPRRAIRLRFVTTQALDLLATARTSASTASSRPSTGTESGPRERPAPHRHHPDDLPTLLEDAPHRDRGMRSG
ncbi:helix-turn-helix domain-containing protein [Nannocystis pusilla]|uniref:helix-turn-helix domain-containing protein n=1 Tax=Nannocystis pusilla TaxID=889268 RepID=UPI003B77A784